MFRSADRSAAVLAAALTVCVLVVEPAGRAATAGLAVSPSPSAGPVIVPGPEVDPGAEVIRPVLDIATPALDVFVRTESLDDGSIEAESTSRIELTLAADVLFAFGRAELSPAARARLAEVAERLRSQARGTVQVDGHTDSVGDEDANLALSRRRAEAVRVALADLLGQTSVSFQVEGFGEQRPVAPNQVDGKDNPAGRAKNRRVEIRFDR